MNNINHVFVQATVSNTYAVSLVKGSVFGDSQMIAICNSKEEAHQLSGNLAIALGVAVLEDYSD